MCSWVAAREIHIFAKKKASGGGRRGTTPLPFGGAGIMHVVSENAISVEKKQVLRDASGEVPVDASRDYRSIRIR